VAYLTGVRGRTFVDTVKALLGFKAKGRNIIESGEGYQLREGGVRYKALFEGEKDDIGPENSFFWDFSH